jgi:L-rhamnose-H+ transport protein
VNAHGAAVREFPKRGKTLTPNPPLGVLLHSIGGLAAASFYIPYKSVKGWAWENFWIVGGIFSWLIAPWIFALWLVPNTRDILLHSPPHAILWTILFGIIWGVGGLTFGLTMRYLGIALGYAIALGLCAACGTLIPPIFQGKFAEFLSTTGGRVVLAGVFTCILGIGFSGWAGIRKERELSAEEKQKSVKEFRFGLGLAVAILCGVTSAAMAFAIAAGKPIADLALSRQTPPIWQNLPIFIFIMFGGFLTNFVWCLLLMQKNKTAGFFTTNAPIAKNLFLCILAGVTWYFQFFFYGMGTTKMGKYDFSSWTLHMASIIIFSTLWGIALHEWKGTSKTAHALIAIGLFLLVGAMALVGYGNYLAGS